MTVRVLVIFALNLEDGEQGGGSGGGGFDSHAPISTHLQTPSALAFVVAGCVQLKKERRRQAKRKRGRERKSKSPWRIGGGGLQLTLVIAGRGQQRY